jgi:hypothetical protein
VCVLYTTNGCTKSNEIRVGQGFFNTEERGGRGGFFLRNVGNEETWREGVGVCPIDWFEEDRPAWVVRQQRLTMEAAQRLLMSMAAGLDVLHGSSRRGRFFDRSFMERDG